MNNSKFSKEKFLELKEAFLIFDVKKIDRINDTDMATLIRLCNFFPSEKDILKFKNLYTVHKKNKLEFKDFIKICEELDTEEDFSLELLNSFKFLDKDQDYKIPLDEIKLILQKFGEPLSQEEMSNFILHSDPQRTGYVYYKDFINKMKEELT